MSKTVNAEQSGGLGIRDLETANKAAIMRNLWFVVSRKEENIVGTMGLGDLKYSTSYFNGMLLIQGLV